MQLSFPFQKKENSFDEESFLLLGENAAAFKFFKIFFSQKDFVSSRFPSSILKGSRGCGKTHLLNIFAQKSQAEFLKKDEISGVNFGNFFAQNQFYILEDFDEIKDEELVLHLINSASEAKAFLALSTKENPQFRLKDLDSRLKNIFCVEIKEPSEDSLKQLLVNGLAARQIKLSRAAIDFIVGRIERSYVAVIAALKLIETAVSQDGNGFGMAKIKKIFGDF